MINYRHVNKELYVFVYVYMYVYIQRLIHCLLMSNWCLSWPSLRWQASGTILVCFCVYHRRNWTTSLCSSKTTSLAWVKLSGSGWWGRRCRLRGRCCSRRLEVRLLKNTSSLTTFKYTCSKSIDVKVANLPHHSLAKVYYVMPLIYIYHHAIVPMHPRNWCLLIVRNYNVIFPCRWHDIWHCVCWQSWRLRELEGFGDYYKQKCSVSYATVNLSKPCKYYYKAKHDLFHVYIFAHTVVIG